jgi:hypothetical protein
LFIAIKTGNSLLYLFEILIGSNDGTKLIENNTLVVLMLMIDRKLFGREGCD